MRLTCPNCNAQYEVDDRAIPRAGRDVQCSACAHTWYQYPREVALEMRAAELEDDDEDDETGESGSAPAAGSGEGSRIDKTVLDVIREEAKREMEERKRGRGSIETQGDLGLQRPKQSKAAPSRVFGELDPAAVAPEPQFDDDEPKPRRRPAAATAATTDPERRRNLLPDIEELSSTLEPGSENRRKPLLDDEAEAGENRRGFRRGLTIVVLVALAFVVLYKSAPALANLPYVGDMIMAYAYGIDGMRYTVSETLRGLLGG
ncbi:MAG: zinc-ribbon domain-containing protein [Paracoccaceae bacterium]